MNCLSDMIEVFIKRLLNESEGKLELQRNELAIQFNCAPSQINYVLTTRFSVARGYCIESRRGGGGYIRIIKIDIEEHNHILQLVNETIGERITLRKAEAILARMHDVDLIDDRESIIMLSALQDQNSLIPHQVKDNVRANLLRAMLNGILRLHS